MTSCILIYCDGIDHCYTKVRQTRIPLAMRNRPLLGNELLRHGHCKVDARLHDECVTKPESRNSPLKGNGLLTYDCPGINKRSLHIGCAQYNRRIIQQSVLFPVRTKL
jgi:hypothetical protein